MSGTSTRKRLGEGLEEDRPDWERVDSLTDADIALAMRGDPGAVDPGLDWLEQAMVLRPAQPKERLTMRVDADVVGWFRARGRGYQTRMNAVLRAYVEAQRRRGG
jgi:uncharacterized protein (DUF4415 family)